VNFHSKRLANLFNLVDDECLANNTLLHLRHQLLLTTTPTDAFGIYMEVQSVFLSVDIEQASTKVVLTSIQGI
jgi:hypothetical protein